MFKDLQGAAYERMAEVWDRMPSGWRRRLLFSFNDHFLIGAVGLFTDEWGRVLLLEHRFRTPWRWGLPGGFVSRGETFATALARELQEEVDLPVEVDRQPIDWEMNGQGGYLSVTLKGRIRQAPEPLSIRSPEIVGGGFYDGRALPEGLYPYHRALILEHLGEDDAP